MLRSEMPSGMCAKLRTVAASNNRVHTPRSLCYCLFTPHICMVLFFTHILLVVNHTINATPHAHPARGESHNQRNTTGEVATIGRVLWFNIPSHTQKILILCLPCTRTKGQPVPASPHSKFNPCPPCTRTHSSAGSCTALQMQVPATHAG